MSNDVIKRIKEERKFLHDMANHITIIQGLNSLIISDLENSNTKPEKVLDRMQKANASANKMAELLKTRRTTIITEQQLLED